MSSAQPEATAEAKESSGYSSPQIRARRDRILKETRKMIGDQGVAGVAMEEVAARAGVAKRTIYNAFQSKERLIAMAIQQYFDAYARKMHFSAEEETLDRLIVRLAIVIQRNLEIRNYTRALMNVYFAHDIDGEIREAIYRIAADSHAPYIRKLEREGALQPWVRADDLIEALVGLRYALAHSWAEGQIADDRFMKMLIGGFLTQVAGATQGETRAMIEMRLEGLDEELAAYR